jgi:hypothetical protein
VEAGAKDGKPRMRQTEGKEIEQRESTAMSAKAKLLV